MPIKDLRDEFAWVLLGEPGAGKSTVFKKEDAQEADSLYLSIAEFIERDPEQNKKTLFLDGLDEARAGEGGNILYKVKRQLKKWGNPRFRIACRAADWYGLTDREDLTDTTPDNKKITVFHLIPLDRGEIIQILRDSNFEKPEDFIKKAQELGIADLLSNPQMLNHLTEIVKTNKWPNTRNEIFELACEKLADEHNKRHRDQQRIAPITKEKILAAAGQLCAVLLCSNKIGLALDTDRANEHFITLDDCVPSDEDAAATAMRRKLFIPEGEERVIPNHRSIAEYLAAKWLADQIDNKKIPSQRIFNLLFGPNDRVVAGLRGLYAWLALHCRTAREQLINADPFTVVIYGDVNPMLLKDKRRIFEKLCEEANGFSGFPWGIGTEYHRFAGLAEPDLREQYLTILQSAERNEISQACLHLVLIILSQSESLDFSTELLDIIQDESHSPPIRSRALDTWLKKCDPKQAMTLLDDITDGKIIDYDDGLAGTLLNYLYPEYIEPTKLFNYLHAPKNPRLISTYIFFWLHKLSNKAPKDHLPILMDQISEYTGSSFNDNINNQYHFAYMAGALLLHSIEIHGDNVSDDRLYKWLGIDIKKDENNWTQIKNWLEKRPERHKALLSIYFKQCENNKNLFSCIYNNKRSLLHSASPPTDIGLWHLNQVAIVPNEKLAKFHLSESVNALANQRGANGLSLDYLNETASKAHPKAKDWLDNELLQCQLPDWHRKMAIDKEKRKQEHDREKQKRFDDLQPHLSSVRESKASIGILYQLAGVWAGRFLEVYGKTIDERFENFYGSGVEIQEAAKMAFKQCPFRTDLPTVAKIISLDINRKYYPIRLPCLLGMDLLWKDDKLKIDNLSDDILCRMIAFQLTAAAEPTDWYTYLVNKRPQLVADVLIQYASAKLKSGDNFISDIHSLANNLAYKEVAIIAVPNLLKSFPIRARKDQLRNLDHLLEAALRYIPEILPGIANIKISRKGMDMAQKIHWLCINAILDPGKNQAALWRYAGKTEIRVSHLDCLLNFEKNPSYELPVSMIDKLIELMTPYAETNPLEEGFVGDSTQRGYQIQSLIARLSTIATKESAQVLERLLTLDKLKNIKLFLENACNEQKLRQREKQFSFLEPRKVAQILANKEPANVADLAALALEAIDSIAIDLRSNNDDGYRVFWNIENKKKTGQREENLCRDVLLTRMRNILNPLGIDCQPEGDYHNDKRADIRLSYKTEFELPIEIKRDSNPELWSGLKNKLIDKYAIAPGANGYGIYWILWFDGKRLPPAIDGGKKPRSPDELKTRLEALLQPPDRTRIFIRVLDVSWQE